MVMEELYSEYKKLREAKKPHKSAIRELAMREYGSTNMDVVDRWEFEAIEIDVAKKVALAKWREQDENRKPPQRKYRL